MRPGYDESPINSLPPVVWALALPMIASEVVFGLGQMGFIGGNAGAGLRLNAIEMAAYFRKSPRACGSWGFSAPGRRRGS